MATSLSFQGVTSGLQTDALINAIMEREGQAVQRLKDKQALNTKRSTALNSMRISMSTLTTSMAALNDKFATRSVSSTDSNNTYVTATATGASSGSYEVKVTNVATKGQLGPVMVDSAPTTLAVADPNAAILTAGSGDFTVQGTDGVTKSFKVTNNSLNGLRDAINSSGAGVTATVINTGKGTNPYQLVVTAKETGAGTTGGKVTLATANGTEVVSSLGITSGGLSSTGTGIGQNALFSVNGIEMTRASNTVKDAVDGVTFTLKKGDASNTTTLTVAQDKTTATAGMQDVVTKFNALLKIYKDAAASTKDSEGGVVPGALTGDSVAKSVITQLRSVLGGSPDGIDASATFKSAAELGIKTNSDGTLSLDTTAFQNALDKDPEGVMKVFQFSGTSTSGAVSFGSGTPATATGQVDFNVTYGNGGAVTGSLVYNGTTYGGLTGTNGTLQGPAGTPLEGLQLKVTSSGSGTLTLSRGIGQKLQDTIASLSSYSGSIETTRASLDEQNRGLTSRIDSGQVLLDKRRAVLKAEFDRMEATISQLRSASGGLSSL